MGCALAIPLVAGLVHAASAGAELGLLAEGRSTVAAQSDRQRSATAAAATPSATGALEAGGAALTATYAPRIWSSDLGSGDAPFVNHAVEARVESRAEGRWRGEATAAGVRGRTDPLADLARTTAATAQLSSLDSLRYEELRATIRGAVRFDERTELAIGSALARARTLGAAASSFPPQRGISVDASLAHRVGERDTLAVFALAGRTLTETPGRTARTDVWTASASWRRRATARLELSAGAGASLSSSDATTTGAAEVQLTPSAEAGLSAAGGPGAPNLTLRVRVTPQVDRLSGAPHPMVDGALNLEWPLREGAALGATAFGGARTDGATSVAGGEARVSWPVRERLAFETGVRVRWQQEERAALPSFFEGGVFAGVAYRTARAVVGGF